MPTYYGNRSGYNPLAMFPTVLKWLIGINAVIFVIGSIPVTVEGVRVPLEVIFTYYGALWPIGDPRFGIWQYFSYMFLHGDFAHVFLNLLILWMFGVELAQMWGGKRFLAYYLICGIGAGILHSIVSLLMDSGAPTVGASGAIMGVMIAFGLTFPNRIILAFFFFPMPAKFAVFFFAGIDLLMGVLGSNDGVAHFAHVGGAVVGYILLRVGGNITLGGIFDRIPWFRMREAPGLRAFRSAQQPGERRVVDVQYRDVAREEPRRNPAPRMDFGDEQARIDAILDKISHSGYQSLTEEEKAILVEASKKMR